jgi:CrcB protein
MPGFDGIALAADDAVRGALLCLRDARQKPGRNAVSAGGFLAVGVGAMLGAWTRWGLGALLNAMLPSLPLGTLVANLAGGFLIGVAVEFFLHHALIAPEWRLFIITGFLGSLTTFSTFSAEAVELLSTNQYGWAMLLIGSHLAGSLLMTVLGMFVARGLWM